jgi:hypothetical protein
MQDTQDVLKLFGATEQTIFATDELAALTKLHPATIRRRFMDEDGVIRLGHPATRRKRHVPHLELHDDAYNRLIGERTAGRDETRGSPCRE